MPYVDTIARNQLIVQERPRPPRTAGELNFVITSLLDEHILLNGCSYDTLNKIVGVLECAKLELYRRIIAPYEDRKCRENGDVYSGVS